jgi:hypothetical protein
MAITQKTLADLRKPFPADELKKNQSGLDYVAIDGYLGRLLDTLGLEYEVILMGPVRLELLPEDMKTSTGKRQFLAQVSLALQIGGASRPGVGADVSFDADKAVKTALAEAMKKACHQYGIALELWDESHRATLATDRALAAGDLNTLKAEVYRRALTGLDVDIATPEEVAGYFNVNIGDLNNVTALKSILGL